MSFVSLITYLVEENLTKPTGKVHSNNKDFQKEPHTPLADLSYA